MSLDALSCPLPLSGHASVQLAHGGGGRLMRSLIEDVFLPAFANPGLAERHDATVLPMGAGRVAFTTDSYVVSPLFFPGGDIGKLAVYGTVNDLAMAGARPAYLSCGFILEEGLPMADLERIVASMSQAAAEAGVYLVTGDTKVVDHGKGDGIFINTAGIGLVEPGVDIRPSRVRPGDAVLVSGDLGRHGVAILSVREGLSFETPIASDCGPLASLVAALLEAGVDVHCLRDLTRGGLASALNEVAMDARVGIEVQEAKIPVHEAVAGACELLGLDPCYVANEGRLVAFVAPDHADLAVSVMRAHPQGTGAAAIGTVQAAEPGVVTNRTWLGGKRLMDLLSGEQLPRIC